MIGTSRRKNMLSQGHRKFGASVAPVALALLLAFASTGAATQTGSSKMLGAQFPLYMAVQNQNAIVKVDSLGNTTPFASGGLLSTPEGLALDTNGNLYVGNRGGANILRIDKEGNQTEFVAPNPLLPNPVQYLAFDSAGYLYAAGAYTSWVAKVDSQGHVTQFTQGGYIQGCAGIVFDSADTLYVASVFNWKIVKVDSQGQQTEFVSDFLHVPGGPLGNLGPMGLVFDSLGALYGSTQGGTIVKVDAEGKQTVFAQLPYGHYPAWIAVDAGDNLYAGDYYWGLPVMMVTPDDVQSVFLSTPYVSGLAFTLSPRYTFSGFLPPVDMGGVWNTVKGGSTVPFKFEVFAGPTELTDVAVIDSFTAKGVTCPGASTTTVDIEFTTTGGTSLRYDPVAGHFIQNWKTPKNPGACYEVTMKTDDGSTLVAKFKLK
jgi:sugar lactone lactonase YvrE